MKAVGKSGESLAPTLEKVGMETTLVWFIISLVPFGEPSSKFCWELELSFLFWTGGSWLVDFFVVVLAFLILSSGIQTALASRPRRTEIWARWTDPQSLPIPHLTILLSPSGSSSHSLSPTKSLTSRPTHLSLPHFLRL